MCEAEIVHVPREEVERILSEVLAETASNGARVARESIERLAEVLKRYHRVDELLAREALYPDGKRRLRAIDIALWLAEADRGTTDARIDRLDVFLEAEKIPFQMYWAYAGPDLLGPIKLGNGFLVMPASDHPFGDLPAALQDAWRWGGIRMAQPTVIITRSFECHRSFGDRDDRFPCRSGSPDARTIASMMSVAGPTGMAFLASWCESPDWLPYHVLGPSTPATIPDRPRRHNWDSESETRLHRLHAAIQNMSSDEVRRVLVPVDRLNGALTKKGIDKAIDLGIAAEALFLSDMEREELSFRLRLRAARMLSAETEERERLFELFKAFYKIRSKAVHTGVLPKDKKGRPSAREIMFEVETVIGSALLSVILEGWPNWARIELS